MSFESFVFQDKWRSGLHVGDSRPTCVVEIQGGKWKRDFGSAPSVPGAEIPGESKSRPWRPVWSAMTAWTEIPGIASINLSQAFDQNGMTVASIGVENTRFAPKTGAMGNVYHAIERGYLSPFRGYRAPGRPASAGKTEWYDILAKACRIRVWQGYGPPQRNGDGSMPADGGANGGWSFNGIIDDIDLESTPTTATITARVGKMLTDSRLFGWNKSRQLKDPVTFCDRAEADDVKKVGSGADASSLTPGFPAREVLPQGGGYWRSQPHSAEGVTEWVQIRLPKGRYTDFVMDPKFDGMEMYVGIYIKGEGKVDGVTRTNQWVGTEEVPGENGGWRYVRKANRINNDKARRSIGAEVEVPDNSILRVGFRRLAKVADGYAAGVQYLKAERRRTKTEAAENEWILVDDLADVVKTVLRWAGFTEWEVESTGVRLAGKVVFNRATFLIDIIQKACEQTGNVFFVAKPTVGNSWGVPTWTSNAALFSPRSMVEIRDTQMLTGMNVKISEEPLPYIIRVRGKVVKGGTTLGGDSSKRIMAVYRPPWWDSNRLAGIIKHSIHTQVELKTYEECLTACYLWAVNAALGMVTATCETMGNPVVELNDQVSVVDTGTGMNTRMWVSNMEQQANYGPSTSWKMTLGGAMIDTPEMAALIKEIDR